MSVDVSGPPRIDVIPRFEVIMVDHVRKDSHLLLLPLITNYLQQDRNQIRFFLFPFSDRDYIREEKRALYLSIHLFFWVDCFPSLSLSLSIYLSLSLRPCRPSLPRSRCFLNCKEKKHSRIQIRIDETRWGTGESRRRICSSSSLNPQHAVYGNTNTKSFVSNPIQSNRVAWTRPEPTAAAAVP